MTLIIVILIIIITDNHLSLNKVFVQSLPAVRMMVIGSKLALQLGCDWF